MKEIASGSESAGYEVSDRLIRAKRYSLLAKMLSDQGVWVIVCAIAMFDEVREWNRANIKGYIEIFLDVPDEVLKARDKKGIYKSSGYIQFPKSPDIKVLNDGSISVKNIVESIKQLNPVFEDDYDRDRNYWNEYYNGLNGKLIEPSSFAVEINKKLHNKSRILELGCGNGRDSLYFLSQGHVITAVDGSDTAIDMLNSETKDDPNALFIRDDFVKCKALYQMQYDCVYSRFTLHAINVKQETEMLCNAKEALASGGILCIEARTIHDDIFGKGIEVEHNAFIYNDHFRRFIDINEFKNKLQKIGFIVDECVESRGFSKTDNSDPMLMRIIARVR